MAEKNPVAAAIRNLRLNFKMTQVELARKANIPRATLALMESPKGNPSISTVLQVASALGVPVGELMASSQESMVTKVNGEDMQITRMDDGKFLATLLSPLKAPRINVNLVVLLPGCNVRGRPHTKGSHEFFYCHDGEALVTVNGEEIVVAKGDLIYFPGNLPHYYANFGNRTVQAFSVVAASEDLS